MPPTTDPASTTNHPSRGRNARLERARAAGKAAGLVVYQLPNAGTWRASGGHLGVGAPRTYPTEADAWLAIGAALKARAKAKAERERQRLADPAWVENYVSRRWASQTARRAALSPEEYAAFRAEQTEYNRGRRARIRAAKAAAGSPSK